MSSKTKKPAKPNTSAIKKYLTVEASPESGRLSVGSNKKKRTDTGSPGPNLKMGKSKNQSVESSLDQSEMDNSRMDVAEAEPAPLSASALQFPTKNEITEMFKNLEGTIKKRNVNITGKDGTHFNSGGRDGE